MKKFRSLSALFAVFAAFACHAAIEPKAPLFTVTGTAGGTTNYMAIVPIGPGTPVVNTVQGKSDLVTSVFTFTAPTNALFVTGYTNASGTPYLTFSTNTTVGGLLTAQQKCIHYKRALGTYSFAWVSATNTPGSGSGIFATMGATSGGATNGDILYLVAPVSTLWNGAETNGTTYLSSGPLVVGKPGLPLGIEMNATSAGALRTVSGRYE